MGSPVYEVVVVKVHEDGDWLAEDNARPHDDVPHLTSEQGNGREGSKGNLLVGGK